MKRRDITLGEMQDECSFRGRCCETIGGEPCEYYGICNQIRTKSCLPPEDWDLTDPTRFNEAQMAFWHGWYEIGARWVKRRGGTACVDFSLTTSGFCASYSCVLPNQIANELEEGKAYDLAELLGKDAT